MMGRFMNQEWLGVVMENALLKRIQNRKKGCEKSKKKMQNLDCRSKVLMQGKMPKLYTPGSIQIHRKSIQKFSQ